MNWSALIGDRAPRERQGRRAAACAGRWALIIGLAALLSGCPAATLQRPGGPSAFEVRGPFTHEYSGMMFPERVGGFQRGKIVQHDEAGYDVSAGYDLRVNGSRAVVTVYVYPIPPSTERGIALLRDELERVKAEVVQFSPTARLLSERLTQLEQGGRTFGGILATFGIDPPSRFGGERFLSHAYVFAREHWLIKYRVTYPATDQDRVGGKVEEFIRSLRWPPGDGAAPATPDRRPAGRASVSVAREGAAWSGRGGRQRGSGD